MTLQDMQTIDIPLHKLTLWDGNVRTSGAENGLAELIASITSVGLLHSLVVQKAKRGQYAVVAGKRRFLALTQMADSGNVKRSFPVPCRVAPEDADLTEISLAENVVREEMSVLSELQAFLRLVETGKCVADVAARFGVSEAVVNRRLALARVSPVLLDLYSNDQMPLDVLQAFTLTDDHATQERVWNELQPWNRKSHLIRQILSKEDILATDKRVRFVGLASYEAAGGKVKRDLFSEGEDGAYIVDAALLTRLADEKLQTMAAQATTEGWKWVHVQPDADHQALGRFRRIQPIPTPLPKKDAAKVEKLEKKQSQLQAQMETDPEADENEIYDQIEGLQEEMDAIEAKHPATFDTDTKARCGVVVTIGHNGEPQVVYGLMRKEDAAQLGGNQGNGAEGEAPAQAPITDQPPPAYSAVLVETLTAIKTAAIAAELSQQPNVALAGVAHALVLSQFGLDLHLYRSQSSIQINSTQPSLAEAAASKGVQALSEQKTAWLSRLPKTPNALWQWILAQPQDTLLALLAFCAALSVNGVKTKNDSGAARLQHADAVATALKMDMRDWFTPTADNFFSKVSKTRILETMTEAGKANASAGSLKKGPLAELAETTLAGTGWLPEPIRIAPEQPEDNSFALFKDEEEVTEEQP